MSRLLAAAFAVVAFQSADAFAQAEITPGLGVTAVGNTVEITLTRIAFDLPGLVYRLEVGTSSGNYALSLPLLAANLPAQPRLVVSAPTGNYYLRARAEVGAIAGPWSPEASVAVGLQPCVPGTNPVLNVSVANNNVNVSWTAVPGALSYIVQWSRSSGDTEIADVVTTTATTKTVPLNGTFYVRVVATTNGCDNATSNEEPFTIAVTRRHLSAGEITNILLQVRNAFPRAFSLAHTSSSEKYDYIILACRALYQAGGGTVGCNWRRATIGDLSMDGLSVENPANGRFYFADVIAGAGGSNPQVTYSPPFHDGALLRDGSGNYAPWGFANPFGVAGSYGPLRTAFNYGPAGGW